MIGAQSHDFAEQYIRGSGSIANPNHCGREVTWGVSSLRKASVGKNL